MTSVSFIGQHGLTRAHAHLRPREVCLRLRFEAQRRRVSNLQADVSSQLREVMRNVPQPVAIAVTRVPPPLHGSHSTSASARTTIPPTSTSPYQPQQSTSVPSIPSSSSSSSSSSSLLSPASANPSPPRYHGVTLTSFTSLTLHPVPLVAFSLRLPSRMADYLRASRPALGVPADLSATIATSDRSRIAPAHSALTSSASSASRSHDDTLASRMSSSPQQPQSSSSPSYSKSNASSSSSPSSSSGAVGSSSPSPTASPLDTLASLASSLPSSLPATIRNNLTLPNLFAMAASLPLSKLPLPIPPPLRAPAAMAATAIFASLAASFPPSSPPPSTPAAQPSSPTGPTRSANPDPVSKSNADSSKSSITPGLDPLLSTLTTGGATPPARQSVTISLLSMHNQPIAEALSRAQIDQSPVFAMDGIWDKADPPGLKGSIGRLHCEVVDSLPLRDVGGGSGGELPYTKEEVELGEVELDHPGSELFICRVMSVDPGESESVDEVEGGDRGESGSALALLHHRRGYVGV